MKRRRKIEKTGNRGRAAPVISQYDDPRRIDPPRYYWKNLNGVFVNFDHIEPHGIMKIMARLDEEGPKAYLEIVERIARARGIIDDQGNSKIGAAKETTAPATEVTTA
jgi:hypothetical protein